MFVLFNLSPVSNPGDYHGLDRGSVDLWSEKKPPHARILGFRQFASESEGGMDMRTGLLIVAAATSAAIAAADSSPDYECLSNDGGAGSGISVDPSDCAGFIMCSNGIPYKMDCPKGTLFSATLLVCDFPHNVDCDGRPHDGL